MMMSRAQYSEFFRKADRVVVVQSQYLRWRGVATFASHNEFILPCFSLALLVLLRSLSFSLRTSWALIAAAFFFLCLAWALIAADTFVVVAVVISIEKTMK
jgi:asparagine N-glycosylation enzyme membrane subunit Stt3